MQFLEPETEPDVWPQIASLLDDAMDRLSEKDRDAAILRFFEGKSFAEVVSATGASEDATKKRVQRALERLRHQFAERGVVSSASAIADAIATHSIQAAPVEMLQSLNAAALAKGAFLSSSTLALVKATLNSLFWAKVKSAATVGAGLLAVGGALTLAAVATDLLSRRSALWVAFGLVAALPVVLFCTRKRRTWRRRPAQRK